MLIGCLFLPRYLVVVWKITLVHPSVFHGPKDSFPCSAAVAVDYIDNKDISLIYDGKLLDYGAAWEPFA